MYRHRRNRPDTRALELIGLGAVLARDELEQLARYTDIVGMPAGSSLCQAGAYPRQFVAVLDGYVEIDDGTEGGRVSGAGTRIGGDELLDGVPHPMSVRARTACELVVIFGPALSAVIGTAARRGDLSAIEARLRAEPSPAGRRHVSALAG